jgi:hypothetical protein
MKYITFYYLNSNHNNTWLCPGYFQFVSKFIQEVNNSNVSMGFNIKTIKLFNLKVTALRSGERSQSSQQLDSANIQIWQVNSR